MDSTASPKDRPGTFEDKSVRSKIWNCSRVCWLIAVSTTGTLRMDSCLLRAVTMTSSSSCATTGRLCSVRTTTEVTQSALFINIDPPLNSKQATVSVLEMDPSMAGLEHCLQRAQSDRDRGTVATCVCCPNQFKVQFATSMPI